MHGGMAGPRCGARILLHIPHDLRGRLQAIDAGRSLYFPAMLRFLVLLLAFVLPVQFAWAGAAAYCQHEREPSLSRHFGHHEHVHKPSSAKTGDSTLALDTDCGTCHASCAQLLPMNSPVVPYVMPVVALASSTVPRPSSAPPGAPDRPQWTRLA